MLPKTRSTLWSVGKRSINGVQDYVKSKDIYGQPVSLNVDGKEMYQSFIGGVLSIILLSLVAAYGFIKFKYMVNIEDWDLTQ